MLLDFHYNLFTNLFHTNLFAYLQAASQISVESGHCSPPSIVVVLKEVKYQTWLVLSVLSISVLCSDRSQLFFKLAYASPTLCRYICC